MTLTDKEILEEQVEWEAHNARQYLPNEDEENTTEADVLDINFRVNMQGEVVGVMLQVTVGGPNIWIDTFENKVKGWSWGDYAEHPIWWDAGQELFDYYREFAPNISQ